MADPLWIALLLLAGLLVMALEVFVPSGGVLGFLSAVSLVAAVAMAFMTRGAAAGVAVLAIVCGAVPAVLGMAFRFFPRTPLGRRVLPPPPAPDDVVPDADRRRSLRGLVGRAGRSATDMLPWGVVSLDGATHEVAERGLCDAGVALLAECERAVGEETEQRAVAIGGCVFQL